MKKRLYLLIGLIVVALTVTTERVQAVQAIRTPIARVQPDGDTLMVLLRGDEHQHWSMTLDGYLVRENDKGVVCYLQRDKRQTASLSKRQAHNADRRRCCERRWLKRHGIRKENKI